MVRKSVMSGLVADTTSSLSRLVTGVGATFRPYKSNEASRSSELGWKGLTPVSVSDLFLLLHFFRIALDLARDVWITEYSNGFMSCLLLPWWLSTVISFL